MIDISIDAPNDGWASINTNFSMKAAIIKIDSRKNYDTADELLAYCAEKFLVHELLHLLIVVGDSNKLNTIEEIEYDCLQHQKTEFMARSLIMAKYGVDKGFFKK